MNYLTISDFAQRAGVSKQAIYKQIHNTNSQLYPYVMKQGNRTFIGAAALKELYNVEQPKQPEIKPDSTKVKLDPEQQTTTRVKKDSTIQPEINQGDNRVSTDYINFLKGQIEQLQATIREKDLIIQQQSERQSDLAQQIADLARNAQQITSQQQCLAAASTKAQPHHEQQPEVHEKPRLFDRLFRKQ